MNKTVPNLELKAASRSSYCIFVDCVCGGMMPVWRDEAGKWIVFNSESEAFAEVMDLYYERFCQYPDDERDFDEVSEVEDVICEVTQLSDGLVVDAWGRVFGV